MQCDCDDTIDDFKQPSKICNKHFAWLERVIRAEREECAAMALEKRQFDKSGSGEGRLMAERIAGHIRARNNPAT